MAFWVASRGPETHSGPGKWDRHEGVGGAGAKAQRGLQVLRVTAAQRAQRPPSGTRARPPTGDRARRPLGRVLRGQGEAETSTDPETRALPGVPRRSDPRPPCLPGQRLSSPLQEKFLSFWVGSHPASRRAEPLMGLLAPGADTSLFCSFPLQPCPLTSSPAHRGVPGQAARCPCCQHPAAGRRGLRRRFPLPHW